MRYITAVRLDILAVRLGVGLACSTLAPVPAAAGEASNAPGSLLFVADRLAEWNVALGGGVLIGPKYEGSDEMDVQPIPFATARLGEHVTLDPRGLSVELYSFGSLSFSGLIGYDTGRDESDSSHLRGLGDIGMGGVVGATVTYELGPAEFYGSLGRIVGGSDGLQAQLGFRLAHEVDQFRLSAGVSASWADQNYMQSYFGVSAAQSALSGLPRYDIGAGFKRVDLELSATYAVSERWLVRGEVGLGYLLGDVADSPVVQRAFQPSAMLLLGYRF